VFQYWKNSVTKAAKIAWPGDDIPLFQNNKENLKKLDDLVATLKKKYSVENRFEAPEIRLHILNTLAERRRNIKRKANSEEVRDVH